MNMFAPTKWIVACLFGIIPTAAFAFSQPSDVNVQSPGAHGRLRGGLAGMMGDKRGGAASNNEEQPFPPMSSESRPLIGGGMIFHPITGLGNTPGDGNGYTGSNPNNNEEYPPNTDDGQQTDPSDFRTPSVPVPGASILSAIGFALIAMLRKRTDAAA